MTRRRVLSAPMTTNNTSRRDRRSLLAATGVVALVALAGCGGGDGGVPQGPPVGESGFGNAEAPAGEGKSVIYLHHSTGGNIWKGGIEDAVKAVNEANGTDISIKEQSYPYKPHPWDNNPYEYWNLWVNHSGENRLDEQPTLEQITADYDVVAFKHCYTAAGMEPDDGNPDVSSYKKTTANYKLQYEALKTKLNSMPDKTFVLWTVPPKAKGDTTDEAAKLTNEFVDWVKNEWDVPGDNIHLWDYHALAMEGSPDGLHPQESYSVKSKDSHPGKEISALASTKFAQRLADVMAGKGDASPITG